MLIDGRQATRAEMSRLTAIARAGELLLLAVIQKIEAAATSGGTEALPKIRAIAGAAIQECRRRRSDRKRLPLAN